MKNLLFYCIIAVFLSCQESVENQQNDKAKLLNSFDSLTNQFGPRSNDLISYFKDVTKIAKSNGSYLVPKSKIDSLEYYYENFSNQYKNTITFVRSIKTENSIDSSLKFSYIAVLEEGKAPWDLAIPVYIKLYQNGESSLNESEKEIILNAANIFRNSANKVKELSILHADNVFSFVTKYNLKLLNDKYQ